MASENEKPALVRIGKYGILARIGQGAMGEVFKAHDPVLDRFVAIKTIAKALDTDNSHRERFQREARAAAQLAHPNIITIFEAAEDQGIVYMAMELLDGTDLQDLIEKEALKTTADKLAIMEQICEGLGFAHARGIIHRDLKPGNIHVLPNGQVKIMDFGLARRSEDMARTSMIMGTPYYMAPEQARGERATSRSDVFALGGVFYELLSGRRPFGGESIPAVLFSVVHRNPEPLGGLVKDVPFLVPVVEKALAKDPEERYRDAGEMREALREARSSMESGSAVSAPRPEAAKEGPPPGPRPVPLSEDPNADPAIKEAIRDIYEYLADRTPPLMVAESVAVVLNGAPGGVAADLHAWAQRQRESQPDVPLADLAFHALRKLHLIGEFKLVEPESLSLHLRQVSDALMDFLAPGDREGLAKRIAKLGEAEMVRTGPIGLLHREPGEPPSAMAEPAQNPPPGATPVQTPPVQTPPGPAPAGADETSVMRPEEMQNNLRRLSLLEERLQQGDPGPAPAVDDASRSQLISETLATAATQAANEKELEEHLRRLRPLGVGSGADEVFRSLGRGISDWAAPSEVTPWKGVARVEVEAMRRIVSLAGEPIEMARRFRHLVNAAIEQFNEGNLGRAVSMFELAASLTEERNIDDGFAETVQRKGHESLDQRRMKQYLGQPERHAQLRVVLGFFTALSPSFLLDEVRSEPRRDRRRFLLDLLEVHGAPARATARTRLLASAQRRESDPHIQRNWIYLIRLLPRSAEEEPDEEIAAVAFFASPDHPPFLVREAISFLGKTKHPKAMQALIKSLREHEKAFSRPAVSPQQQRDWQGVLDRIAGTLARFAAPSAWKALLDHALAREPSWGATLPRLTELGEHDLSGNPEVLARIFVEIKASIQLGVPSRLGRKDHDVVSLLEALAHTPTPEVRKTLEEVASAHPATEFGKAATRVLRALSAPAPPPPPPNPSGEVDALGLTALLVRFTQEKATGMLCLQDKGGPRQATLAFQGGALVAARQGHLEGADAVYQLFERPLDGTYVFEQGKAAAAESSLPEVTALLGEAVRRAGELPRQCALVPDDVSFLPTGGHPSSVPDETDHSLVASIWEKAGAGMAPRRMEEELSADAFRIRRVLAHWVEGGALLVVLPEKEGSTD